MYHAGSLRRSLTGSNNEGSAEVPYLNLFVLGEDQRPKSPHDGSYRKLPKLPLPLRLTVMVPRDDVVGNISGKIPTEGELSSSKTLASSFFQRFSTLVVSEVTGSIPSAGRKTSENLMSFLEDLETFLFRELFDSVPPSSSLIRGGGN